MRIRYSDGKTHAAVVAEASEWFIDLLGVRGLIGRVVACGSSELREHFRRVDRDGLDRAPHRVLMNHMAGNRKKIGFGAADALVPLDSQ